MTQEDVGSSPTGHPHNLIQKEILDMRYVLYFALVFLGFIGGLTTYPFFNELRDEFDDD